MSTLHLSSTLRVSSTCLLPPTKTVPSVTVRSVSRVHGGVRLAKSVRLLLGVPVGPKGPTDSESPEFVDLIVEE